ncbi:MAG: hypothetical protein GWN58_33800 [Anaerolineae bacterium]|nr:hypothetical protein [Thermoplasmata archaeon]NIV34253.1 hypothetical protein [Anaerolineae bacterium]NIY06102.1 hypothetical protein [Thermoplasmata archaeon]
MPPQKSPSAQGYADKPFEASVQRVNPNNEKITVDSAAGPDDVVIPHPMLSTNSWVRAMPEKGARVVAVSTAGGTLRRVVVGYFSRQAADLVTRYKNGVGLYRPIKAGEWDQMTPGVAYVYGTVQGKLYLRGGPVHQTLDPQRLHIKSRAPTHRRECHEKFDNEILDEERFGVVVRNTNPPTEKNRWLRAPDTSKEEGESKAGTTINKQPFAKEYLRIFGRSGNRLAALMEGDLFDDKGQELKHSKTSRKLRLLRELYDKEGEVQYQHEIDDEKGAIAIKGNADRIDITEKDASAVIEMTKLLMKLSQSLDIQCQTSSKILAQTTAQYGGTTQTNLGPAPQPIDFVLKGTTFNATVMTPLISGVSGTMQAVGAQIQKAAEEMTKAAVGPPPDPVLAKLAPAIALLLAAGISLQSGSGTIAALAGALAPSLSTNVKTSP